MSLRAFAIGREPVHELFAVLDDGPFVPVFEKDGMRDLKFFQSFDRGLRKPNGNMLVVSFHKNRQRCHGLIEFQFYISRSHRALMIAQISLKINPAFLGKSFLLIQVGFSTVNPIHSFSYGSAIMLID